jgi:outer membrane protein
MKRSATVTFTLWLICLAGNSIAQISATPAPRAANPAIVTINFNAAVLATAEAQRDLGALQTKFTPKEAQLQKLNDAIEAVKKQLSDGTLKLSDSERNAKDQDLINKEKQLQREAEDLRNDSQADSQQVFQRIGQKLFGLLQEYSQQHGYSVVIERGTDAAPIVWYAAANVDITERLAKAYDLKFGTASSNLPDNPSAGSHAAESKPRKPAPQ